MEKDRPIDKQRCKAMIDAGIADPGSQEGILFCAGESKSAGVISSCPYSYCVVLEYKQTATQLKRSERRAFARKLRKHKVSIDDIALILGETVRFVRNLLKK